jgi:hypothetical protein
MKYDFIPAAVVGIVLATSFGSFANAQATAAPMKAEKTVTVDTVLMP